MHRLQLALIAMFTLLCSACDDGESSATPDQTSAGDAPSPDLVVPDGETGDLSDAETGDVPIADQTIADVCVPQCAGVCGDDGCGSTCGTCQAGTACSNGACVPASCPTGCTTGCDQGCFDYGACVSTTSSVDTWPSVFTAGVVLDLTAAPETSEVFYRRVAEPTWWRGHDATRIPDGTLASSLFYLSPETDYEVMFRVGGDVACASFTTLPEVPAHIASTELFVAPGGTGSGGSSDPFGRIQDAVDAATAGTDIHVAAGVYHESVSLAASGSSGAYIRLLGEPGAILDGSDPNQTRPPWTADGANVWRTPWAGNPSYLARDGARLYHYLDLQGLRDGIGDDGESIAEGWFVSGGELFVRSSDDPASHDWNLPVHNTAVALDGNDFIWIEGLEIRHYGEGSFPKGIDVRDSDDIVVRSNHIHETPSPVWVRRGSSRVRVEDNRIHQSTVASWPWPAVKGTDHENTAISLSGGSSLLAARNDIHDIFNGVGSGAFSDDQNTAISYDVDVHHNRMRRVTDDGLEPEGACVNNRFWSNVVDEVHNGISLAPITHGPVWVLRNRFTDYTQSGFKVSNDSSGRVWLYHNTSYVNRPDQNGMGVSGPFANMVFRNNIIHGTRYAIEMSRAALPNDLDYDNLHTTRGAPEIKWDDVRYDTIADLCAATGLECNAVTADPSLVDPAAFVFALGGTSPNIDRAVRIYGINDGFAGTAPDIGYVELGGSELSALP